MDEELKRVKQLKAREEVSCEAKEEFHFSGLMKQLIYGLLFCGSFFDYQ